VKKTPAGSEEQPVKTGDDENAEGATSKGGKEGGKAKGRQKGERGRREPKDRDGEDAVRAEGKSKGKGKNKGKKGGAASAAEVDDPDGESEDDNDNGGSTLLKMLKSNSAKVIQYTRSELLAMARLPASNIKPADLSPLIDKENKDSNLLVRIAAGRDRGEDGGKEDGEGNGEEGAARRGRKSQGDQKPADQNEATVAETDAGAAAVSSASDPRAGSAATPAEDQIEAEASRAFSKWFDRTSKAAEKPEGSGPEVPKGKAAAPAATAAAAAAAAAGAAGAAPSTPTGSAANPNFAASRRTQSIILNI
jgi:hypothetical protein